MTVKYVIKTQPSNGTVTVTDNVATYTPNAGFTGTDSFQYIAHDNYNASSPSTVTVTVNAAPSGSIYSVLGFEPDVVADFANDYYRLDGNDTTFSGLFNFTRASSATYSDANGNLQTAASGEPRVGHHEYDSATDTWVNKGILLEPQATNVQLGFTGLQKENYRTTISAGGTNSPLGTEDGVFYVVAGNHPSRMGGYQYRSGQPISSSDTCHSVFVKPGPNTQYLSVRMDLYNRSVQVKVDLINGVVLDTYEHTTNTTIKHTSISKAGNGWWKVSVGGQFSLTSGATGVYFGAFFDTADPYPADGTAPWPYLPSSTANPNGQSFYIFGPQRTFSGSLPTSYIPTTGSAVTRAADVLTIPAANVTQGTVTSESLQGATLVDASNTPELVLHGTLPEPSVFVSTVDNAGSVRYILSYLQNDENGENLLLNSTVPSGQVADYSIAYRYGQGALQIAEGGTASALYTPAFGVTHSFYDSQIMSAALGNGDNNGTLKLYRQWREDITEAGIEEASS